MGYYSLVASCILCGATFASNPHRVPAYLGEPVCANCVALVNRRRRQLGLPEWPVLPGAYEPADEQDGGL